MSEIVDDLLNEVEQLENATKDLQSTAKVAKNNEYEFKNAQSAASSESHLIALQTAQTSQEAATQSQKAAQASIKQAEALKSEILELNESNFNWRKNVREAAKDFTSVKKKVAIMLIASIIFSLIAVSAMGYLFYAMKKQQAQFKGEILDIIATENTLLKKDITLKVDELASVIENLNIPLNQPAMPNNKTSKTKEMISLIDEFQMQQSEQKATSKDTTENTPETKTAAPVSKMMESDSAASKESIKTPEKPDISKTEVKGTLENKTENIEKQKPVEMAGVPKQPLEEKPMAHETLSNQKAEELISSVKWLKEHSVQKRQLDKVKGLINQIQAQLKAIKSNPSTMAKGKGLTAEQMKKLDGIGWLVRKQSKMITKLEKDIQALSKKPVSDKNYTKQLEQITKEQTKMRQQLVKVEESLGELTELSKEPPPYSYRAK